MAIFEHFCDEKKNFEKKKKKTSLPYLPSI